MTTNQILILVSLVLPAIGATLIWFGLRSRKLAAASKSWPRTSGTILISRVDRFDHTVTDGRNTYSYKAVVEYEYVVEGKPHRGNRVQFGRGNFNTSASAQKMVGRYPTGAVVDVYFDPSQPAQ